MKILCNKVFDEFLENVALSFETLSFLKRALKVYKMVGFSRKNTNIIEETKNFIVNSLSLSRICQLRRRRNGCICFKNLF